MHNKSKREFQTFTGKMFNPFKPEVGAICIEDIAHHLACINRYNGATKVPYSVAEHCVRVSYLLVGDPLLNLMHDAPEAYIGDIISPQKMGLCWLDQDFAIPFISVEAEIQRCIGRALGIPGLKCWLTTPRETKEADLILWATEVRDLMPPKTESFFREKGWLPGSINPLEETIEPWEWFEAEDRFLRRYVELIK